MPPRYGLFWGVDMKGAKPTRGDSTSNPMTVML